MQRIEKGARKAMYTRIMISTDGSELGGKGVDHGLALAKALGVPATIVTVTERFPVYSGGIGMDLAWSDAAVDEWDANQKASADAILAAAGEAARRAGVAADLVHVSEANIGEALIAAAQKHGADLIVMASHGRRGLGRLVLGSKTSEVLSHSQIPVLVVR